MKSRTALIAGLVVALAAFAAPGAVAEETPPNAIVSEGNGAAVFLGYGGTRSVSLCAVLNTQVSVFSPGGCAHACTEEV